MDWLNLHTSTLDSPEFIGAEPIDRATWICLLRYCIGQENSGVIKDCREWPDRKWQQLARITKDEALSTCALWKWHGSNIAVWGYPMDKQETVQRLRKQSKAANKKRWPEKQPAAKKHPEHARALNGKTNLMGCGGGDPDAADREISPHSDS